MSSLKWDVNDAMGNLDLEDEDLVDKTLSEVA